MDDTPKVEVPGTDKPDVQIVQNIANDASNEVEMAEISDQPATAMEDIILIDAQTEPEPPTPAKKSAAFKFLE
jgi:hypothetical protein